MTWLTMQLLLAMELGLVPVVGDVTDFAGSMSCLEDAEGTMTFDQVTASDTYAKFKPSAKDIPNFGFTKSVYWCRAEIENQTQISTWVLEVGYPLLDYVDLYLRYTDGQVLEAHGGDMLPFAARYRPHRTINFSATVGQGEILELFLRVRTESSVQLPLKLKSESKFGDLAVREMVGFGVYYGIILVMIVFNALIYLTLRDKSYLNYVGFLAFYLLFSLQLHGTGFQYLFSESPLLANKFLNLGMLFAEAFLAWFTVGFLSEAKSTPKLLKFYSGLGWFFLLAGMASLVVLPYGPAVKIGVIGMAFSALFSFAASLTAWRRGYRPAATFLMAIMAMLMGSVLLSLKTIGVLPSMFITDYGMQVGTAMMVMLLSLALADRIRITQLERDVANEAMLDGYKRLEAELSRREEIQDKNDALLAEMEHAQDQLIQADKLSSLGQLTAGVAHDIANPTSYIATSKAELVGYVDVVQETLSDLIGDDPSPEAQELREFFGDKFTRIEDLLGHVGTGTDTIRAIHQAIRNYTRVEQAPEPNQDLGPIVGEAVTILSSKLKDFDVAVELDGLPTVTCRRSQLGQVFTNLLSNAADALHEAKESPEGNDFRGRIAVRGVAIRHGGQEGLAVRVEDNGPGIPVEYREKILQAFYTTKAVGKGTGLGMSICQRIMDAHDGTLGIGDSVELGGASMIVWLPLKPATEKADR